MKYHKIIESINQTVQTINKQTKQHKASKTKEQNTKSHKILQTYKHTMHGIIDTT